MNYSPNHYPRIYALLQRRLDQLTAAQIVLDAMRGEKVAYMWVRMFYKSRRGHV
jgi:hypothetical protein